MKFWRKFVKKNLRKFHYLEHDQGRKTLRYFIYSDDDDADDHDHKIDYYYYYYNINDGDGDGDGDSDDDSNIYNT